MRTRSQSQQNTLTMMLFIVCIRKVLQSMMYFLLILLTHLYAIHIGNDQKNSPIYSMQILSILSDFNAFFSFFYWSCFYWRVCKFTHHEMAYNCHCKANELHEFRNGYCLVMFWILRDRMCLLRLWRAFCWRPNERTHKKYFKEKLKWKERACKSIEWERAPD